MRCSMLPSHQLNADVLLQGRLDTGFQRYWHGISQKGHSPQDDQPAQVLDQFHHAHMPSPTVQTSMAPAYGTLLCFTCCSRRQSSSSSPLACGRTSGAPRAAERRRDLSRDRLRSRLRESLRGDAAPFWREERPWRCPGERERSLKVLGLPPERCRPRSASRVQPPLFGLCGLSASRRWPLSRWGRGLACKASRRRWSSSQAARGRKAWTPSEPASLVSKSTVDFGSSAGETSYMRSEYAAAPASTAASS
mmetsp:Transcript_85674/g.250843  ORF Transcript_85674/g.250843 Transcript_85674/m.250843 type:complete len:250 (-) Transcript_85674:495-1244(-)